MDKNNLTKEYSNGEVTIVWQSGKCVHSGNCIRNSPKVFKPKEHPWINTDNATTSELVETVLICPSGALTFYYNKEKK